MATAMLGAAYVLVQCLTCFIFYCWKATTVVHIFIYGIFFFSLCVCLCVGLFVALALVCGMLNQNGNSAIGYQSTLPPENELNKNRRASSLELILSPMRESTLQRK